MKEEFQKLLDKTYRPETWNPAASELKEDTARSILMGIGRIGVDISLIVQISIPFQKDPRIL